jgi:hypothetical protein
MCGPDDLNMTEAGVDESPVTAARVPAAEMNERTAGERAWERTADADDDGSEHVTTDAAFDL